MSFVAVLSSSVRLPDQHSTEREGSKRKEGNSVDFRRTCSFAMLEANNYGEAASDEAGRRGEVYYKHTQLGGDLPLMLLRSMVTLDSSFGRV